MKICLAVILVILSVLGCSKTSITYINNPDDPEQLHDRPVGVSANDLLSSSKYSSLKIEVQYMTGYQPDAAALNHLQAMLAGIVNKPSGISIITKEIPGSSSLTLSLDDILTIERNNRTTFTSGSDIAIYILYSNGNYTDPKVLGMAYRNTSAVLFGKKINDNSGSIGQASRTKLVATVAEHELGHLLGLVGVGSPMQTNHKDATHGNHCSNNNCLMYYTSETSDILGFLIAGNIPSLDAACKDDLRANGGQ